MPYTSPWSTCTRPRPTCSHCMPHANLHISLTPAPMATCSRHILLPTTPAMPWCHSRGHGTRLSHATVQGGGHPLVHTNIATAGPRNANCKFRSPPGARSALWLSREVRMTQIGHLATKLWPENRNNEYLRRIRGRGPSLGTREGVKWCVVVRMEPFKFARPLM